MEKYVVFGPIIIFFGIFFLLIFGFIGFVGKLVLKAKNDAWIGEVIDKKHNVVEDNDGPGKNHYYSFRVKLENGEEHNIPATAKFYSEVEVGDKLKKDKGSLWPKKI